MGNFGRQYWTFRSIITIASRISKIALIATVVIFLLGVAILDLAGGGDSVVLWVFFGSHFGLLGLMVVFTVASYFFSKGQNSQYITLCEKGIEGRYRVELTRSMPIEFPYSNIVSARCENADVVIELAGAGIVRFVKMNDAVNIVNNINRLIVSNKA